MTSKDDVPNGPSEPESDKTKARRAFLKKAARSSVTAGAVTLMLSAGAKAGGMVKASPGF